MPCSCTSSVLPPSTHLFFLEISKQLKQSYLSLCSFQVRVCWAASPWCCWWRCCGWRRCCCSCCTSIQHGGTVAEKRGVNVSKRVSSTRNIRFSVVSGWSTRRSTPWTSLRVMVWHQINIITPSQRTFKCEIQLGAASVPCLLYLWSQD